MRYRKIILAVLVIVFLLTGCGKRETTEGINNPYLGQKLPGKTPEIFAPGIVSTGDHLEFGCTWSPDGKQFLFTRRGGDYQYNTIMICRWENDSSWTAPDTLTLADGYPKMSPRFFPDGSSMVYTAWRPPGQAPAGESPFSLWITGMSDGKWKDPVFFKPWSSMSVSGGGDIYCHGEKGIGISKEENGRYRKPVILGEEINTGHFDQHPFVSPKEDFFLFDSHRPGGFGDADLYVAFPGGRKKGYRVVNLGESINTPKAEFCPVLSPDGKFLFYTSGDDIWWVDAQVIEDLKPKKNDIMENK